ncbi:uncharacterized protein A4U43_C02F4390 [Asparagus officinalis]|uniref:Methyltransferase type 11 domain-containing protein n=1 Tax=Asparagus officinalis TaxID=4686 RepID=A0A5P1FIJ3_ASPOF|nr:uncharacterized protein A4U43_C02F4390 [Asparagus officinalis]
MLRRYVRSRPEMKWRVMDMTEMQFTDEFFDVILDKGGLDALMEPEHGVKLGSKYLKEVKRVLKMGGRYLCLTLAESHVLGLLFSEFRFGWETNILAIAQKAGGKPSFQTFLVSIVKEKLGSIKPVISSFDHRSLGCNEKQIKALVNIVEEENQIRTDYSSSADIMYSLQELQLGAKGNLKELQPGRRFQVVLGEQGESLYTYRTVLLDAKQQLAPFLYHCGVFIVPKTRAHEWLFTSEEGQWLVVESSKAARLIMVFLDSRHSHSSIENIQKDLSPLVKGLAPGEEDDRAAIPFMMANDGVKERNIVHKVTSTTTGPIIVEDVIYESVENENSSLIPSEVKMFRRLTFERSLGLVQSEALLTTEEPKNSPDDNERRKNELSSKSKKKGRRKTDSRTSNNGSKSSLKVDHRCLASTYHSGIVSGFSLIAPSLENAASSQKQVKTVVIGLGAGLLPMFLHGCFPFLDIEVVELDSFVVKLARDYFGFTEDLHLKVRIGDGIKYIQDASFSTKPEKGHPHGNTPESDGKSTSSLINGNDCTTVKILIVDADSSDLSAGLTCPPADFVEESFLVSVRKFLAEGGLFVINLVSRSSSIREMVVSRMTVVFDRIFSLELEEDVNEVLFATTMEPLDPFALPVSAPSDQSILVCLGLRLGFFRFDFADRFASSFSDGEAEEEQGGGGGAATPPPAAQLASGWT